MTARHPPLLKLLSRTTSSGNFIPEIDGLRCLAIAAVIAFHLAGYVAEKTPAPFVHSAFDAGFFALLRTGHIGVQLFFVISGFVVALPFAMHHLAQGKKVNLRRYYLRRLTRIEPPYVIALIFWLLAFGISGMGEAPMPVLLRHFPASLLYLHNAIYHEPSYVLPPAWSLEIEIQFYLIAPLLAMVFRIHPPTFRRAMLLILIFALAASQRWLRAPGQLNGLYLFQEAHFFLIGLLLVDLHVSATKSRLTLHRFADILATVCAAALPLVLVFQTDNQTLITLIMLLFVGSVLNSHQWRSVLSNPWIYTFGGMCYSTYLYHGFFKALPGHFTISWQISHHFWLNFLLQAAMLTPMIMLGSTIMYLLAEKPFMGKPRRSVSTV